MSIFIDYPWISVEDKLPDLLQKVLFHWVCPAANRNISMGYRCEEGWDIYLPYHSYKMHPLRLHVTHWSELPKFPEISYECVENLMHKSRTLFEMEFHRCETIES